VINIDLAVNLVISILFVKVVFCHVIIVAFNCCVCLALASFYKRFVLKFLKLIILHLFFTRMFRRRHSQVL
jgi:hypothetical protein